MFKKRVISYEVVDLPRADLVTVAEAAELTGLSMPGVIRAVERGQLTEFVDEAAGYHGRRLLLRVEVEHYQRGRVVA